MNPATQLKLCAVMFTVLWTGWMLWSSGSLDHVNVIIMTIGGSVAGYTWYRVMRWQFQRSGMLPHSDHPADSAERR